MTANNPEFKIKITKDEKDVQKLLDDAGKVADKVAEYQRQIEEHGSIFPGAEKSFNKATEKAKKYYDFLDRFQKKHDKEKLDAQKKFYEQAEKVVGTRAGLSASEKQRQQSEIANTLFMSSDIGRRSLMHPGMSKVVSQLGGLMPQPEPQPQPDPGKSIGQYIVQHLPKALQQSGLGGGGGIGGMGLSGLARAGGPAAGLGVLATIAYKTGDEYKDFVGTYQNLTRLSGKGAGDFSIAETDDFDRLRRQKIAGFATNEEGMASMEQIYRSGGPLSLKSANRAIEANRLMWGSPEQMNQFMGRTSYYGANKDLLLQMQAYRKMGTAAPDQLLPMITGTMGIVSGSTGQAPNWDNMMGVIQSMYGSGKAQGYGELGMQTMQKFHTGMTTDIGKELLIKAYSGKNMSYADILDKVERGVEDPDNLKMMRQIITESGGGKSENMRIIARDWFKHDQGSYKQLFGMGGIVKAKTITEPELTTDVVEGYAKSLEGGEKFLKQKARRGIMGLGEGPGKILGFLQSSLASKFGLESVTGSQIDKMEKEDWNERVQKELDKLNKDEKIKTDAMSVEAGTVIIYSDGKNVHIQDPKVLQD